MRHLCKFCRREFTGRSDAIYCGSTCKSREKVALRKSGITGTAKIDDDMQVANHPLVMACRRELEAAGRMDSVQAAAAVGLASAMCSNHLGPAAFVATSKELSRVMAAALKGAPLGKPTIVRPVDDLTSRRTKRQKAGYSSHS